MIGGQESLKSLLMEPGQRQVDNSAAQKQDWEHNASVGPDSHPQPAYPHPTPGDIYDLFTMSQQRMQ